MKSLKIFIAIFAFIFLIGCSNSYSESQFTTTTQTTKTAQTTASINNKVHFIDVTKGIAY
ncbi:MAG: hypothetical protein V8S74_02850 [Lachnospirales bacterium]